MKNSQNEPHEDVSSRPPPCAIDVQLADRRVVLTSADQIKPKPARWLWRDDDGGRVPLGEITLTPGVGGIGKSLFHCWFVAQVSRGQLPGIYYGTPRGCIVVATEDSWAQAIVPRLIAQGADLSRVYRADVVEAQDAWARLALPTDLVALESAIRDHAVAVVSLDPLLTLVEAKLDTHKDHEVRRALEPLKQLAETTGCSILANAHNNKGMASDPVMRITGSAAFSQVARAVMAFAEDKIAGCYVISQVKNNHGRLDLPSISYKIESEEIPTDDGLAEVGKLVFTGRAERSVQDIMASSGRGHAPARNEAEGFLMKLLADGPRQSTEVKKEAKAAGISPSALRRARERICWDYKAGMADGWYWKLKEDDHEGAEGVPVREEDIFSVFEDAPLGASYVCKREEWWTNDHGRRLCAICHPPHGRISHPIDAAAEAFPNGNGR